MSMNNNTFNFDEIIEHDRLIINLVLFSFMYLYHKIRTNSLLNKIHELSEKYDKYTTEAEEYMNLSEIEIETLKHRINTNQLSFNEQLVNAEGHYVRKLNELTDQLHNKQALLDNYHKENSTNKERIEQLLTRNHTLLNMNFEREKIMLEELEKKTDSDDKEDEEEEEEIKKDREASDEVEGCINVHCDNADGVFMDQGFMVLKGSFARFQESEHIPKHVKNIRSNLNDSSPD